METKVKQKYKNLATRFYEEGYRYSLNCDLNFFPGNPEYDIHGRSEWDFSIWDDETKTHVWKGTLQELMEKIVPAPYLKPML